MAILLDILQYSFKFGVTYICAYDIVSLVILLIGVNIDV